MEENWKHTQYESMMSASAECIWGSKFSWKIPAAHIISSIVVVSNEHIIVYGGMYPPFQTTKVGSRNQSWTYVMVWQKESRALIAQVPSRHGSDSWLWIRPFSWYPRGPQTQGRPVIGRILRKVSCLQDDILLARCVKSALIIIAHEASLPYHPGVEVPSPAQPALPEQSVSGSE